MQFKFSRESGTLLIVINNDDIVKIINDHKYALQDYPFNNNMISTLKLSDISRIAIKYKQ